MIDVMLAATHSTAPWYYILIPLVLVGGVAMSRWRRGGGGGRGPFGGSGGSPRTP